jgi:hypothetical protein
MFISRRTVCSSLRYWDVYPGPGSRFLSIPDPTTAIKEEGEKTFCPSLFVATIIIKLKQKICLQVMKKVSQFTKNSRTFYSKLCVWDQRSGIRKKPIPDPGSTGHKGTESRSAKPVWFCQFHPCLSSYKTANPSKIVEFRSVVDPRRYVQGSVP